MLFDRSQVICWKELKNTVAAPTWADGFEVKQTLDSEMRLLLLWFLSLSAPAVLVNGTSQSQAFLRSLPLFLPVVFERVYLLCDCTKSFIF